jgi:hypothetical protein
MAKEDQKAIVLVDDQSCDALGIYVHYLFLQTLIMEHFINRSEKKGRIISFIKL